MYSKILVLKLRSLGDTVLMTAPLAELSRLHPKADIHVLVPEAWAPILEPIRPNITRIWTYQKLQGKIARGIALARLASQLRKEHYDCAINFHASPTSAFLARATGAPTRSIHFHGHHDRNLFSTVSVADKGKLKPIIERDMDTVRALGGSVISGVLPKIFLTAAEKTQAKELLTHLKLKPPVLGINLGASRPTKQWPVESFARVAALWALKEKGGVLAFAGPKEKQFIEDFESSVSQLLIDGSRLPQIKTLNDLDIRALCGVLGELSVVVGNDSGPKHIAVAVGTPTVTLFGPEHPFEWHPYPTDTHPYLFIDKLECRDDADRNMPPWCALSFCETEDHRCMKLITVDTVMSECQRIAIR